MTPEILNKAVPNLPMARATKWAPALTLAMECGDIVTRKRQAAFLAQIGHESGSFLYAKELGGPAYFMRYEGRKDLGNTEPGDGSRFAGRGLIQVTGRTNYAKASQALFGDARLLDTPELLEQPEWAAKSAVWYWSTRNLNVKADADQFDAITRAINGGTNGSDDRKARYAQALSVLV